MEKSNSSKSPEKEVVVTSETGKACK